MLKVSYNIINFMILKIELVLGIIITITASNLLSIPIGEASEDKNDTSKDDNQLIASEDKNDTSKDDNQLTERDVAALCGASEDYEAHKEQCVKLYEMLKEGVIKDDPNFEYD